MLRESITGRTVCGADCAKVLEKGLNSDEDMLGLNVLSHPGSGGCWLSGDEHLGLKGGTGETAEGPSLFAQWRLHHTEVIISFSCCTWSSGKE